MPCPSLTSVLPTPMAALTSFLPWSSAGCVTSDPQAVRPSASDINRSGFFKHRSMRLSGSRIGGATNRAPDWQMCQATARWRPRFLRRHLVVTSCAFSGYDANSTNASHLSESFRYSAYRGDSTSATIAQIPCPSLRRRPAAADCAAPACADATDRTVGDVRRGNCLRRLRLCIYADRNCTLTQVEPDLFVVPHMADLDRFTRFVAILRLLLVVEVLSPCTRKRDREYKRPVHLADGVREYWIVEQRAVARDMDRRQSDGEGAP